MAWGDDFEEGEQEEEEEDAKEGKDFDTAADYVMVLILAVKSMFEPDKSGQAPVITAFKLVQRLLKQKIILSRRDKVGLLLVGVDQARDPEKEDEDLECSSGYYALQEMDQPTAKRIRELEQLSSQPGGAQDVIEDLRLRWKQEDDGGKGGDEGAMTTVKLNAAFRACSGAFAKAGAKPHDSRRIWLFTNDDSPNSHGDADPTSSISDQLGQGAHLKLWYFNRPGQQQAPFDLGRYWGPTLKQLGASLDDEDEEDDLGLGTPEDARSALDKPASEARHQGAVKRRYTRMPLRLSPTIRLQVALYKTVAPCRLPMAVNLRTKTMERIAPRTDMITESGISFAPDQAKTAVPFAGQDVFVSRAEFNQAAAFGAAQDAGMDLLGFVPQSSLTWSLNTGPPTFVYPEDAELGGSTVAFISLHSAMLARRVMGLVAYHRSPTAAPRLAVLMPQEESDRDPPGLQLVFLPWRDDSRALPPDTDCPAPNPGLVKAARAVVSQLTSSVPYDTTAVPNPALQKHYAHLEGLALMEKEASNVWDAQTDDATLPPEQAMVEVAEEAIEALVEASGLTTEAEGGGGGGGGKKRPPPAAKKEAGGGGKRAKKEEVEDVGEVDVVELVRSGRLEGLTVAELKDVCGGLQLVKGGKKGDLIARITDHVAEHGGGAAEGGRKKKGGGGGKRVVKKEEDDDDDEAMLLD